jgi:hypothetical protein
MMDNRDSTGGDHGEMDGFDEQRMPQLDRSLTKDACISSSSRCWLKSWEIRIVKLVSCRDDFNYSVCRFSEANRYSSIDNLRRLGLAM